MVLWLKAILSALWSTVRPLKHSESFWGWVQMLMALGIITGGIIIPDALYLRIIIPLSVIAILTFLALVRSQKGILDIEAPIDAIIQELKSKKIRGFSMLEIFDALRDSFALGLTYPQIHSVLKSKLYRDVAWGIHSSDILATFTQLGLIHSPSIDSSHSVLLDNQRTIPNYVYQLTDTGKLLAHKLMSQKTKD